MISTRRCVLLTVAVLAGCDSHELGPTAPLAEQHSEVNAAAPPPPTNVSVTLGEYASAVIDWTPSNDSYTIIERKVKDFGGTGKWEILAGPYHIPHVDGPLPARKIYVYRLTACNNTECSAPVLANELPLFDYPPGPPKEVRAAQNRFYALEIDGTAKRADQKFFSLTIRGRNNNGTYTAWRDLGRHTAYGGAASFYEPFCMPRPGGCLPILEVGATYYYGVRTCTAGGCSEPTPANPVTVYDSPPGAVGNLNAAATAASNIDVTWTEAATVTHYKLYRRHRLGDGTFGAWGLLASPSEGITSYSDGSLGAATQYQYRIRACNGIGCSDFTFSAKVTTPAS